MSTGPLNILSCNRILILGMDTFRHKNIDQIEVMNKRNFIFDVFTNDSLGDSLSQFETLKRLNRLFILKRTVFSRFRELQGYFRRNKTCIHHAEIYSAGRFSIVYILLCKYFNIKSIIVERGDINHLSIQPYIYRSMINIVYKLGNFVWYKEPYMKALLNAIGVKQCVMIPNAVGLPRPQNAMGKTIDFLWANRLVKERRFDWVANYLYDKPMIKTVVIGAMSQHIDKLPQDVIAKIEASKTREHFEIHGYVAPRVFYEHAKFFILPATLVYGNYALLEAMSYGLIPIVSETDATNMIVRDGVNGIVFKHDYTSFCSAIDQALAMDEETRQKLSLRARQTISDEFSLAEWSNKLISLYSGLGAV